MASGDIKILDSLSINQNIIGLVISYIGVVYVARLDVDNSYLYCLVNFIGCLCSILFFICTLSVISSMIVYASIEKQARRRSTMCKYRISPKGYLMIIITASVCL